jgi:L-methionine (R)-S-oxide reductase
LGGTTPTSSITIVKKEITLFFTISFNFKKLKIEKYETGAIMMVYDNAIQKIAQILKENRNDSVQEVVDYLQTHFEVYNWVGVYLVKKDMLHLGPWQGPKATDHTIIPIGKGICGAAVQTGKTQIVSDVHADDRYLSCFLSTRSEIVVPLKQNGRIIGEIDIDSDTPNAFTEKDESFLKKIADMLVSHIHNG